MARPKKSSQRKLKRQKIANWVSFTVVEMSSKIDRMMNKRELFQISYRLLRMLTLKTGPKSS